MSLSSGCNCHHFIDTILLLQELLCSISANKYGIEFLSFRIKDYNSKEILFDTTKGGTEVSVETNVDNGLLYDEDSYRKLKYTFTESILRLQQLESS